MGLSRPQQIGNVTHNQLTGRGESDSHPQSSITNLVETLSSFNTAIGAKLSPEDIINDVVSGGADKVASAETVKTLNNSIQLIDVEGMLTAGDVQDTLSSTATNLPLSANKGRELFQYANDGKGLIATAITNRGVVADSSETFSSLAGKIGSIAPAPSVVGNATVDKVLAPYTFSTETLTGATGTMTNRGAVTLTPGASAVAIPAGYHNGSGVVSAVAGLSAGNIANGVTVGGVVGTYKGIGTATAGDVLTGKTFSTGALTGASGTMVNQGAKTLTPGASAVTIPAGYHNGSGVVSAVTNLVASNIKKGVVVGGVTGTLEPAGTYTFDTYTTNQSWVIPSNVYHVDVYMVGGGSGGTAGQSPDGNNNYGGAGGNSGGVASGTFKVTPGSTLNITVGAGGVAQGFNSTPVNNAGVSSISGTGVALSTDYSSVATAPGGAYQTGGNGTTKATGFPAGLIQTIYSGAGGGGGNDTTYAGGTSAGGGNGGTGFYSGTATAGSPATVYGSGGGGGGGKYGSSGTVGAGGAGKAGVIYIGYLKTV